MKQLKTMLIAFTLTIAALALAGCNLNQLPRGECGEGYVYFEQTGKCIRPGMRVLPGAIEGTILGIGAVSAL